MKSPCNKNSSNKIGTLIVPVISIFLDEIKTWLSEKGTCELIFNLVQKYKDHVTDEDSRSILKMACDLIVLIITGGKLIIPI